LEGATVATYWHVAGADYEDGDDLLSFFERVEAGLASLSDWRWEHALDEAPDAHYVSLWANARDALAWIEDEYALDGARIVRVDIPEDSDVRVITYRRDVKPHPAVRDHIPGEYCSLATVDELRAAAGRE
jgi:hypothetical protein